MTIASGFVIRAVGGTLIILSPISPWLIVITFLLALLLVFSKRKYESKVADKGHRKNLEEYTPELVNILYAVTLGSILISYMLYCVFVRPTGTMLLTLPFALFILFRYTHKVYDDDKIAGKAERVFKDKQILIAIFNLT